MATTKDDVAVSDGAASDVDYVSDPDDSPLPAMRRRAAASDDESDAGDDRSKKYPAEIRQSDDESGGAGDADVADGVEEYYDDDDDGELEEEDDYDELGEELEEEEMKREIEKKKENEKEGENKEDLSENLKSEGEKKENEPFAVPTAGAFYMHDDRFQESNGRGGAARRRRGAQGGGRKIWNAKEEGAWVHDRFEEMNLHDNGRRGRGRGGMRGGRGRGVRGGAQRGRGGPRNYYENNNNNNSNNNNGGSENRNGNGNQSFASRSVRGGRGGARRYEPVNRGGSRSSPQDKQVMQRNQESESGARNPKPYQNSVQSQALNPKPQQNTLQFVPKKNIISLSNLNSASPPFYPSSNPSNQDSKTRPKSALNPNTNNSRVLNANVQYSNPNKAQFVAKPSVQGSVVHQKAASQVHGGPNLGEDGPGGPMSNKSKGKQQSGLVYGGPVNVPHGEQGFAGTPALLPVMQFSGQHPGVPTMGMAVPGYVANSQLGFGNSAWVIAGASGGYPYVAGYYNENNNGRPSSSAPSTASAKSPDAINPSQKPDIIVEEPGQRQNKPRRYSEMNFG